jgi:3-hydroxyisobutyrate dehydrogenase
MVADDEVSRAVWLGEQGALASVAPGTILIECSTLSVNWIHELAAAAKERGCALIDAPVTGSKPHAAAGELCFVAGGAAEDLEKVRSVLEVMSRAIVHVGPVGSGALLKLVNNFMCGVQAASFAEAVGVIEKAGLDRTKALELLTNGAPGSPLIKLFSQRMADGGYEPSFVLRLMAKDLAYAQNEGAKNGISIATAEAAHGVFQRAIDAGLGEKDFSAVLETFRG